VQATGHQLLATGWMPAADSEQRAGGYQPSASATGDRLWLPTPATRYPATGQGSPA